MLADRDRAGEGDLLHDLGRDQVLGHIGRHAEHQIEHARRQAGVGEAFHQLDAAARRFFRGLDDERAAGGERAGDLADRRQRREIPRREGRDHADRLLQHELAHALLAARDDAAIGAAAFLGVPVDDVGAGQHLGARLDIDLALLLGLHLGDVIVALAHQIGGLAHDLGAVIGRGRLPHARSPSAAASSAASRSAFEACGRCASVLPVAGLITSSPLRPSPLSHLPSM